MLLERRGHARWIAVVVVIAVISTAWYAFYAWTTPGGTSGGSFAGLTFGIVGTAFMSFAALLGLRKRRPALRVGRASWWLKGHLWLGTLSFLLILFHSGFEFGGALTYTMMILFLLVVGTGIHGLVLQQWMPRYMTKELPLETIYEQIDYELEHLASEAEKVVKGQPKKGKRPVRARPAVAQPKATGAVKGKVVRGTTPAAEAPEAEEESEPDRAPLEDFLERHTQPYFKKRGARRSPFNRDYRRRALFEELSRVVDPRLKPDVATLAALWDQRSQIELQRRLHWWLHSWLLVHVPLSYSLVFLTAVHAVMALYY